MVDTQKNIDCIELNQHAIWVSHWKPLSQKQRYFFVAILNSLGYVYSKAKLFRVKNKIQEMGHLDSTMWTSTGHT